MKTPSAKTVQENDDTGFTARTADQGTRLINRDGSFNVTRRGLSFISQFSLYQYMVHISWLQFHLMVLAGYTIVNFVFACIYFIVGIDGLVGMASSTPVQHFWEVFFFSAQTLTTVGFGRVSPIGIGPGIVSSIESLTGLMGFAVATGLLYGRFSRATPHLMFSEKALVSPYKDSMAMMFRFANARTNILSDISIQWMAAWNKTENGKPVRRYIRLPLERDRIDFLTLSWTVVHPLDEVSPMAGMAEDDVIAADTEFIVILKAYDETFAQNIIYRHSYKYNELVWNAAFTPTFHRSDSGSHTVLELDRIGDFELLNHPKATAHKPDVVDLINEAEETMKRMADLEQKG